MKDSHSSLKVGLSRIVIEELFLGRGQQKSVGKKREKGDASGAPTIPFSFTSPIRSRSELETAVSTG